MNRTKKNDETKEWPTFLKDEPAGEDRLDSFEKLAEATSDMVREIEGGITVCVSGAWGAGKSTFIRILDGKLRSQKGRPLSGASGRIAGENVEEIKFNPHVFVYDAWAHSGDPLRRAFLSSLLQSLWQRAGWLEEPRKFSRRSLCEILQGVAKPSKAEREPWATLQERLAGRYKEVTKTSQVQIGIWGRLFLFAGFAWTVKDSLLKYAMAPVIAPLPSIGSEVAVAVAAWLAFVAIGWTIIWSGGLSAVLANKGSVSETVNTSEEPVPSSIEFAEHFKQIGAAALGANAGRRLIVVLDNLDRLEKKEREDAWAFLRSFIDNSFVATEDWYKQIWVVVPWATPVAESGEETGVDIDTGLSEKLFQIRLDLPPPTLFHWEKSLVDMLVEAFGGPRERFSPVVRVFHQLYSSEADLTMRRIVRFVNDLVVLEYRWRGVPLAILSAYLLLGSNGGVVRALLDNERINELRRKIGITDLGGANAPVVGEAKADEVTLAEQFAMMYYGLSDPGMAMNRALVPAWTEVLQKGELKEALKLLRNRSSVNALRILASDFWSWADEALKTKNTFYVLSVLGRLAGHRAANENLVRLKDSETWSAIAQGVRDAMAVFALSPLGNEGLRRAYASYLRIVPKSDEAGIVALNSIEMYAGSSSLDEHTSPQIASLLFLPALQAAMSATAIPLVIPFRGAQYLRFCEDVAEQVATRSIHSIEDLYKRGFGKWESNGGWTSVTGELPKWKIGRSFSRALPITMRVANTDVLVEAFDSFVFAFCNTVDPAIQPSPDLSEHEAAFEYFIIRMGATRWIDVLARDANRRRMFDVVAINVPSLPPSDVHLVVFLLLLIGGAHQVATETSALEEEPAWKATHVGQGRFRSVMTTPIIANRYADALARFEWLARLTGTNFRDRAGDDTDVIHYWKGMAAAVRAALDKRYPGPTGDDEEAIEAIFAVHDVAQHPKAIDSNDSVRKVPPPADSTEVKENEPA
ncbi:P-loop NTPase fold protein [Paraburkholderia nodosa]|uniref:P-loop NTPase fold protein n=1 Tax=Paraburkholderia nodosa TaxID=392320 RepID=UPI0008414470|nr:P-loop NTPase fold protein [Paraburkholderia nodosa]